MAGLAISPLAVSLAACGNSDTGTTPTDKTIVLGFSQVSANSGWRTA